GVDNNTTGSLRAAVSTMTAAPSPESTEATPVPLPPTALIKVQLPEVASPAPAASANPTDRGSPAFRAALEVLEESDYDRAFHLALAIKDDAERRAIQWAAVRDGNGKIDYASVIRFVNDAPGFAQSTLIKTRLEQALLRADAAGPDIIRALGGAMPNSVD